MKALTHLSRKAIAGFAGIVTCACLMAPAASAEDRSSEVNFQFSGLVPNDSVGSAISDQATKTGGFQVNYTRLFNRWAGVEGGYGLARNTQNYSGDLATAQVQSNLQEMTGAFEFRVPVRMIKVHPYALAGMGALRFGPTAEIDNAAGALAETRGAFMYGGGADITVSPRIGIRADYRGFLFKAPDFQLTGLTVGEETHIAQPSLGVLFKF